MDRIKDTLRRDDAVDPDLAQRQMLDAFAKLNVMPKQLAEHLGHGVEHCTADERLELRALHAALKDGETSWSQVMAAKGGEAASGPSRDEPPAKTRGEEVLRHLKGGAEEAQKGEAI